MLGETPLITTDQYREQVKKWLKALGQKECVAINYMPKMDRTIRLEQLVHDKEMLQTLPPTHRYIFQFLNLRTASTDSKDALCHQIAENLNAGKLQTSARTFDEWMNYLKTNKYVLILIIPEAETLLSPINKFIFSFLSYIYDEQYPYVRILSIFEAQLTHPRNMIYVPPLTRLYQNIFNYPLYSAADTVRFIELCEQLYEIKIPNDEQKRIVSLCGGHWWLVKEAVRQIAFEGSWSAQNEGLSFRLNSFYGSFTDFEQSLIKKLVLGKNDLTPDEKTSLSHFKNMRFVDDSNQLTIPIFTEYVKTSLLEPTALSLVDNHIYVNNVPVDTFFSRKEHHVLKVLIEHANTIVSRDQIAQCIWPVDTHENYSDWAIDQLMKRLRKRLTGLALSPEMIKVARGKGYVLTLTS